MENRIYAMPSATFTEKETGYELAVTLPGIAKDEVELHVEGRTLTLKTASKYQVPAGFKTLVSEFDRDDYAMSLDLPEMADPATLAARLENGILAVTVGKRPETQARKIAIE